MSQKTADPLAYRQNQKGLFLVFRLETEGKHL